MTPFEAYLKKHNVEALQVSVVARVRYMAVYNATKGIAITPENAQKIHAAVLSITNVPYTGRFVLIEPLEDAPTIPIKKIHRHNLL